MYFKPAGAKCGGSNKMYGFDFAIKSCAEGHNLFNVNIDSACLILLPSFSFPLPLFHLFMHT